MPLLTGMQKRSIGHFSNDTVSTRTRVLTYLNNVNNLKFSCTFIYLFIFYTLEQLFCN